MDLLKLIFTVFSGTFLNEFFFSELQVYDEEEYSAVCVILRNINILLCYLFLWHFQIVSFTHYCQCNMSGNVEMSV